MWHACVTTAKPALACKPATLNSTRYTINTALLAYLHITLETVETACMAAAQTPSLSDIVTDLEDYLPTVRLAGGMCSLRENL